MNKFTAILDHAANHRATNDAHHARIAKERRSELQKLAAEMDFMSDGRRGRSARKHMAHRIRPDHVDQRALTLRLKTYVQLQSSMSLAQAAGKIGVSESTVKALINGRPHNLTRKQAQNCFVVLGEIILTEDARNEFGL